MCYKFTQIHSTLIAKFSAIFLLELVEVPKKKKNLSIS